MPHGKLTVFVDSGAGIEDPTVYGNGGSFCTLTCGSQLFSSPIVEGGGSHPYFNTAFEIEIDRSTNELDVSLYNKGTDRDDEMVGSCTLKFKTVFYHGHNVPPTMYPLRRPSGSSGGQILMSLKFKIRPSPNAHDAHAPMRAPQGANHPQVAPKIIVQQSLAIDWGYDFHEDSPHGYESSGLDRSTSSRTESSVSTAALTYRRSQSEPKFYEDSVSYQETPPKFIRYGSTRLKPHLQDSPSPNYSRPSAPAAAKPGPRHNQAILGGPQIQVIHKPRQVQPQRVQPPPQQKPNQQQVKQKPAGLLPLLLREAINGFAEGVGGEVMGGLIGGVMGEL